VVIFGVAVLDQIVPILLGWVGGMASLIFGLLFEVLGRPNLAATDLVVIASMLSAAIFGALGALVAHRKCLGWPTGFIFGFCLGLIGFIVMLILPSSARPAPGVQPATTH
jgi:branched-subunit amino acid ABC-type transport system permease component